MNEKERERNKVSFSSSNTCNRVMRVFMYLCLRVLPQFQPTLFRDG